MQATAFLDRTMEEAMQLLTDAHDFLSVHEPVARRDITLPDRLDLSVEACRLTARLTHIVSWLMAERAVHEGEISWTEALENQRPLSQVDVCIEGDRDVNPNFPPRFADLLRRSHNLFVRVARLDDMARKALKSGVS